MRRIHPEFREADHDRSVRADLFLREEPDEEEEEDEDDGDGKEDADDDDENDDGYSE
jgi:hypothetical protein